MDLTDEIRAKIAAMIRAARREKFGTKSAAYRQAGVNAATWDNAEAGLSLREDTFAAVLKTLWPESGGNWESVISPHRDGAHVPHRDLSGDWDDLSPIESAHAWLSELTEETEYLRNRLDRMERLMFGDAEPGDDSWSKLESRGSLIDLLQSPPVDSHVLAADDNDHEDEIEGSAEGR